MSDLIDREALLRQIDIDSEGEPGYYGDTWKFIDTIKRMPSAQPTFDARDTQYNLPIGTDCISRQQAIKTVGWYSCHSGDELLFADNALRQLPPIQSEIIRCRECKFASGDSRICMKFGHSPIGELDFCAWAERRTDG